MNHHQEQQFQQNMLTQQQMGSGLTRYRSAPGSYFATLLNSNITASGGGFESDDFEQPFNPRASSPEAHGIFSRFMNSSDNIQENLSSNMSVQLQSQSQVNSQFLPPRKKTEPEVQQPQQQLQRQQSNDYSSVTQMMYQNHSSGDTNSVMDNSYNRFLGSINSNRVAQIKLEGGVRNSNLIRQSSSPAGLFASINIENELVAMRGMGNSGAGSNPNAEASFSSGSRFKNNKMADFSSMHPSSSSSGMMPPISEISSKGIGENNPGDEQFDDDCRNESEYIQGFAVSAWDNSEIMSDNFLTDNKTFSNVNSSDDKNTEGGNRPHTLLSHHLSLPKSSAELSAMEKLLQDSVPCKIRAKRGFATHPRSIAERVRRTKISERMRKLQDLVPNMEKQTNTADMLDLAVDYIKDLQTQVKKLSDNRAKCSCLAKQKS